MDRETVRNCVAREDAELLCRSEDILWSVLDGSTVLVTGATGLIGSQLVNALLCRGVIRVIALIRSVEKTDVFIPFGKSHNLKLVCVDICNSFTIDEDVDYIVHCAAPTSSRDFKNKPLQVIETIVGGSKNVLELAAEQKVKRVVFLSSAEVYGIRDSLEFVDENSYGLVNQIDVRSSYPESKRLSECMCRAFSAQVGLDTVIARMGVVLGPGMRKNDNRVIAQFAKSVLQNGTIILYTEGKTVRSYCYTRDAVKALLILLYSQQNEYGVYNVANKNMIMSIREIVEIIRRNYPSVCVEYLLTSGSAPEQGYMDTTFVPLKTQRLEALGWKPEVGFEESFVRLLQWCKDKI